LSDEAFPLSEGLRGFDDICFSILFHAA